MLITQMKLITVLMGLQQLSLLNMLFNVEVLIILN